MAEYSDTNGESFRVDGQPLLEPQFVPAPIYVAGGEKVATISTSGLTEQPETPLFDPEAASEEERARYLRIAKAFATIVREEDTPRGDTHSDRR